jgi:hypothetical protein
MLLTSLSACALITQAEYDERTGAVQTPDDTGDSGQELPTIEVSGSLSVPDDRDVDRTPSGANVGLVSARFIPAAGDGEEFIEIGALLASGTVDDLSPGTARPYRFDLPALPPEDDLYAYEPAWKLGAPYFLGAWTDTDGDGEPEGDRDLIVGANVDQLLIYVQEVTEGGVFDGPGWYLVSFDPQTDKLEDVYPIVEDYFVYDLSGNLLPNRNGNKRLAGYLVGGLEGHEVNPRVSFFDLSLLLPASEGEELDRDPYLTDTDLGTEGGFSFPDGIGVPSLEQTVDHTSEGSLKPYGVQVASYIAIAYEDLDDDGQLDLGSGTSSDRALGTSAQAGADSCFVTYYQPTSFKAAFMLSYGVDAGWNRFSFDDSGQGIAWDTIMLLDDGAFGD